MDDQQPKSVLDHERFARLQAQALWEDQRTDAVTRLEKIARYHLELAATCQTAGRLCELIRRNPDHRGETADQLLVYLENQITEHHLRTFGVYPAWGEPPETEYKNRSCLSRPIS